MFSIKNLDEIGVHFRTDKSSIDHNFLNFYDGFISPLRNRKIKLLEIGVLNGKSLKVWEAYFPDADIVGADIVPASKRFEGGRTSIEIVDQSNLEDLVRLGAKYGPFDVVIEDGSHMWEHQITSLRTLFPFVKDGGYYIAEDLQTNFGDRYSHYRGVASISFVEYVKKLVDFRVGDEEVSIDTEEDAFLRTYGRSIDLIAFAKRACLIKKKLRPAVRTETINNQIAPVTSTAGVQASIYAHARNSGDVYSPEGYVNLGAFYPIQGFEIISPGRYLEYCAKISDGQWTDWFAEGEFIGSRSEMITFVGIAVRVRADLRHQFRAEALCLFDGCSEVVRVDDGERFEDKNGGNLYGLQISIQAA
ncbi:class I SAM-dependent methyltransferase [Methylobacterium sp. J-090]|uniref:class I SAM-dependent methyltransferase n=1 Tax=Methylobacterium sp. J-090 TaxID=2836666 RepID=UPI001FBA30DC|nr:class I SAM-dependent methyltransferase [Methylobacterium sp. J-090]MCJ2082334.1 class I SAM-dependent methyltransferase [Methylobacterium sp. J-090]